MAGGPTRQDTWRITVQIKHPVTGRFNNYGVWDKLSGGAIDSDETKYNPGGMEDPVSLGGKKTVDNVTLSRLYRLERDHGTLQTLIVAAGKSPVIIAKQPMDIEGNVYGKPLVYRGRLKRVTPPETDSESSGPALVEIEVTVDGFPAIT
jgi:hypothetical protein